MNDLSGKRAIVTGGARGIGAAIARELSARGADVVITYKSAVGQANSLADELTDESRRTVAIQADSADAQAVRYSVEEGTRLMGGLDILVNNAGILISSTLQTMTLADIDRILAVNIRAAIVASQTAIPLLSNGGRIVSIGSCLAERVAIPNVTVYSMSKSALLSFTRGLSRELAPRDITVNLVHPGPTDTDMNPAQGPDADYLRSQIALGRFGSPTDVAKAVAYLAGPDGRHITGTGLVVDGGINA